MAVSRHGLQTLKIARLKLPGDVATRRRKEQVVNLGRSFLATGGVPLAPPVVEQGTWKLLAGRDRVSACMNMDIKEIDCLVVSGTAEELAELTLIENAMRRHSDTEQQEAIAGLVAIHTARAEREAETFPDVPDEPAPAEVAEEDDPTVDEPPKAKPKRGAKAAKAKAYKAVAAATGKTPAAVKAAANRAERKKAKKVNEPEAPEKPAPVINTMGFALPDAVIEATSKQHAALTEIVGKLTLLKGSLTRLENDVGFQFQGLKAALDTAAREARDMVPASVCPYCKDPDGSAGRRDECVACNGQGWARSASMAGIEERLLEAGANRGVFVHGRWVPIPAAEL